MSQVEAPAGYRQATDGSLRCQPGATTIPTECEWHPDHHWCDYCLGYYGVPHEESMHRGLKQHPLGSSDVRSCVCRFCIEESRRLDMMEELAELRSQALDHEAIKAAVVSAFWDFQALSEADNLIRLTTGMERLSNSMSDLSSWVLEEIEQMRSSDA